VSFCRKNSLEKAGDTGHKLIFNAVVKYILCKCSSVLDQSVMVSAAVSKLGKTDFMFVQPGAEIKCLLL